MDLDVLTGGAFSANSSQERVDAIQQWLATNPAIDAMQEVHKELSNKDSGVAKLVKDKLDVLKELEQLQAAQAEWVQKADDMLGASKMSMADGLAWLRDAEQSLGLGWAETSVLQAAERVRERVDAIDRLERNAQALLESGNFFARRIDALSAKGIDQAAEEAEHLAADMTQWVADAKALPEQPHWGSVDAKYPSKLEAESTQLEQVWQTFQDALSAAQQAKEDATQELPKVPVWAEEIRQLRGESDAASQTATAEERAEATKAVTACLDTLEKELAQGHGKASVQAANDLRQALKTHQAQIGSKLEFEAQNALNAASELEGWQRWRANQIREKLIVQAQALADKPLEGQKQQEALRKLRNEWKQTDQGGLPNHTLWKQFDQACNTAYETVKAWITEIKKSEAEHKTQRLALIDELRGWTREHEGNTDWKMQHKVLRKFAERWRLGGHVTEAVYGEIFPKWKAALKTARAPLDEVQKTSLAKRRDLIAQAQELAQAERLNVKAVQALQNEWKEEAQAISLDRKREQKLWTQFRKPLDEAFAKRDEARQQYKEQQKAQLNAHDQAVLEASEALEAANASGDAQQINAAMQRLQAAIRGEYAPVEEAATPADSTADAAAPTDSNEANAEVASTDTSEQSDTQAEEAVSAPVETASDAADEAVEETTVEQAAESAPEAQPEPKPVKKKLVAMRGDDRPGAKSKSSRTDDTHRDGKRRDGKGDRRDGKKSQGRRDERRGNERRGNDRRDRRDDDRRDRKPRAPRLSNAAFHAQKKAMANAQDALKNLSKQAHGAVLVQLLDAWKQRSTDAMPDASAFKNLSGSQHKTWQGAIEQSAAGDASTDALLRLEVAADVPTPAAHHDARRAMQLKLLTERDRATPKETWKEDVTAVLAQAHDDDTSARLQNVLKKLLKTK